MVDARDVGRAIARQHLQWIQVLLPNPEPLHPTPYTLNPQPCAVSSVPLPNWPTSPNRGIDPYLPAAAPLDTDITHPHLHISPKP